ncbi:hypothetical protein [Streptomyces antimycoticus]
MNDHKWERPAAGREPAAAALLAWLADPAAPRMCLVTGSAGCGKSALLAWLVAHGSRPGTPPERQVHAVVPLQGLGVRGALWMLADQLGVVARAPAELVAALAADKRAVTIVLPDLDGSAAPEELGDLAVALVGLGHVRLLVEAVSGSPAALRLGSRAPAVMNLDHGQWTDLERLAAWRAAMPMTAPSPEPDAEATEGGSQPDLDDPAQVISGDPLKVTTWYETSYTDHAGLRTAWLRAGQSLSNESRPAHRALVLQAALGDRADPRLSEDLSALAADAPWRMVWSRVSGDVSPPWPGPAFALAAGHGVLEGELLVADHQGVVRRISAADGSPSGRLPRPIPSAGTLTTLPDGTVLALDRQGHLDVERVPSAPRPSGIEAFLSSKPTPVEQLAETAREHLSRHPGRALGASFTCLAAGDGTGTVHAFGLQSPVPQPHAAVLHRGPVTALAVVELEVSEGAESVPLLYSGGADGLVRTWSPGREPLDSPVAARPLPVTALAATRTPGGTVLAIAWADGLVERHLPGSGQVRTFRPGPPVLSLATTAAGCLVVGTDEMVVCLRPVDAGAEA